MLYPCACLTNQANKYLTYYSVEFVIYLEVIIHAFLNKVFGFGRIPKLT